MTPYWAVQWSWFARVNALCNLSCKKLWEVAVSLPGRFLIRRCFMLCITVEVEPRIAKQYKCHHCCSCKNYWERGRRVGKKVSLCHFLADQKIASSLKKCVLGHPIARAANYCLLPDTLWLRASKNAFKVGSVKFANSLSPPSIVKKICTRCKSSLRTFNFKRCQAKVKGVNNPTWTAQWGWNELQENTWCQPAFLAVLLQESLLVVSCPRNGIPKCNVP